MSSSDRIQDRLELGVQEWKENSNSFRMEGPITPELDRLIKDFVLIRLLVLLQDRKPIAEIKNVRLMGSRSHLHTPRVEVSIEDPTIQFTDYDYSTSPIAD
jgi:hypothetical protein